MSYVPTELLHPVNSLELKTFVINDSFESQTILKKSYSWPDMYRAFCKSFTLTNFMNSDILFYRTDASSPLQPIPPGSQISIAEWNSLVQIESGSESMINYNIIANLVKLEDAYVKQ